MFLMNMTDVNDNFSKGKTTKGVDLLLGNPRNALKKLSIPLIISMMITSLYNIVDGMWIAGLGADALAGVGFVTPIFFMITGVGVGLGSGITAVIARYIGQRDKKLADNASVHAILISCILSLVVTVLFLACSKEMFIFFGATGEPLNYALDFATIIFAGSIFIILPNATYGILRAEGDTLRTMYAMAIAAILNIVLDPIFIYTFNMGVKGAAYATLLSLSLVSCVLFYWFYVKKDTFLKPLLRNFSYDSNITKDILNVGLPASMEYFIMSLLGVLMNIMVLFVANSDAVAVYETGWRLVMFGTEPIVGVSTALVSVVGANYGAHVYDNIKVAHRYGIKLATYISLFAVIILFVFAPQIAYVFSYSPESTRIYGSMVVFLRYFALMFLTLPIGLISTYLFQGVGKGLTSLLLTIIREVICALIFSYLFAIVLNMGLDGVWLGNIVGYTIGSFIALGFAEVYMNKLINNFKKSF